MTDTTNSENSAADVDVLESALQPDDVPNVVLNAVPNNQTAPQSLMEISGEEVTPPLEQLDERADKDVVQRQSSAQETTFVYAVGELAPVFPNQGLQQTFDAAARVVGVSEHDYYAVFNYQDPTTKKRPYFYIAEQVRWVLSINKKNCYQVLPRSREELLNFIDALKPLSDSLQEVLSTVIGVVVDDSKSATSGLTNVICNHCFSQTLDDLHNQLKQQTGVATAAIQDVLKQLEFSPNQGRTDFNRAKNYLAFRYPAIYLTTHSMSNGNSSSSAISSFFLDKVTTNYSDLKSPHTVVDIVFLYKSKTTKQEKYYYCSVDVTTQFPFINSPLQAFMPLTPIAS
ncbi:hypothetical protein GV054_13670 [Marinomonas mediterranea]|uniref:cyanobactin maturation protease PatG family protein n=1 Tax=Marinomonas mediterranea TaxID=119864 RepID=UPI00234B7F3D|nr:hypothetical protein [Marinomonas mediterranea]WCN13971.1 hypothetical protein GV054_13670 [Marinomonas mediterranea]